MGTEKVGRKMSDIFDLFFFRAETEFKDPDLPEVFLFPGRLFCEVEDYYFFNSFQTNADAP